MINNIRHMKTLKRFWLNRQLAWAQVDLDSTLLAIETRQAEAELAISTLSAKKEKIRELEADVFRAQFPVRVRWAGSLKEPRHCGSN